MLYRDLEFVSIPIIDDQAKAKEAKVRFANGWGCIVIQISDHHNFIVLCQDRPHFRNPVAQGRIAQYYLSEQEVQDFMNQVEAFQLAPELAV